MAEFVGAVPVDRLFLGDGGIETSLIYLEGVELPLFAAFPLLDDESGRARLRNYFEPYLALCAATSGAGFLLDTATWRASADWGRKLCGAGFGQGQRPGRGDSQPQGISRRKHARTWFIPGCLYALQVRLAGSGKRRPRGIWSYHHGKHPAKRPGIPMDLGYFLRHANGRRHSVPDTFSSCRYRRWFP